MAITIESRQDSLEPIEWAVVTRTDLTVDLTVDCEGEAVVYNRSITLTCAGESITWLRSQWGWDRQDAEGLHVCELDEAALLEDLLNWEQVMIEKHTDFGE